MKKTRFLRKGIIVSVSVALLAAGCGKAAPTGGAGNEKKTEDTVRTEETGRETPQKTNTDADLISALRAKYNAGAADYSGETMQINRTEPLQLKLGFDPWEEGRNSLSDIFAVYEDAELKCPLDVSDYEWNEETGILSIMPPVYGPAEVGSMEMDLSRFSGSFMGNDDQYGWGNLSQLYLAAKVNAETGEALTENPVVTVLKVNTELPQAPVVKFSQTDDGAARLSWKEVPGAEEYLIFSIKKYNNILDSYMNVFAATSGTEWICEPTLSTDQSYTVAMNEMFTQYIASEDEVLGGSENYEESEEEARIKEYFGVIAVKQSGSSPISNLFDAEELAHMLPHSVAFNATEEQSQGPFVKGTLNLPSHMGVTMCDGTTAKKIMDYDYANIVKAEGLGNYEIKAVAHGTPFAYTVFVTDADMKTLDQDLKAIEERQAGLRSKGGNVDTDISFEDNTQKPQDEEKDNTDKAQEQTPAEEPAQIEESVKTEEQVPTEEQAEPEEEAQAEKPTQSEETPETEEQDQAEEPVQSEEPAETEEKEPAEEPADPEEETPAETEEPIEAPELPEQTIPITANSALCEYLAMNMLATSQAIDISAFPESADMELVVDAFLEAQYQNPLILGVKSVSMDTLNSILYVDYDYDRETTASRQQEIQDKAAKVLEEIITDDMTDLEKELAINQYLCDNAVYDDAALENAEANDFAYVDEAFNDSFTAYGVLVNGIGVCASYSAGFKLLADGAGLESIVVTGYLDGSLPHAWNKVKVDGKWNIVDSTNNDNDVIQNALFNLSDDAAYTTLVQDDRFALDSFVYDYAADSDENEYYRITDRYYETSEIAGQLAAKLKKEGRTALRTDYMLDDDTFGMIAQDVADTAQAEISGVTWMGVIYLEEK